MHGVFTHDNIAALIEARRIFALESFDNRHINNASLDITTDGEIYAIEAVLKPRHQKERVRDLLPMMGATEHGISKPLRVGTSYLAKASIDVNFPPGIYGYANAKSTSGRLFLQSRLLVDYIAGFDTADLRDQGLSAEVWLVLEPLCFDIHWEVQRLSAIRSFASSMRTLAFQTQTSRLSSNTRTSSTVAPTVTSHRNRIVKVTSTCSPMTAQSS